LTGEPHTPPEPRTGVPVWVPFVALLAALVLINLFGAVLLGVLGETNPDDLPDGATIGLTLVQDLIFVYAAWIAVKIALGHATREDFGLRRVDGWQRALKWAAIAFALFWAVTIVLALIFGTPKDQQLVTDIKREDTVGVLIAWAVLICVVAPIVEEFFFRGFMFTVFARRLGPVWGALLVGLVFGAGHAPAPAISLIALGAFGVGLCLVYWRTQSIIPCMALHALNNSITFGSVKDLDPALFAGVVVASVGVVVAAATAVAARPAVSA